MKKSGLADSPFFNVIPSRTAEVSPTVLPKQAQEVFSQSQTMKPLEDPWKNETTERRSDLSTQGRNDGSTTRLSDGSTVRRKTERAAFDLYEDQVNTVRRLRAERELQDGKKISLSDIAREAFDLFLQSHKQR